MFNSEISEVELSSAYAFHYDKKTLRNSLAHISEIEIPTTVRCLV